MIKSGNYKILARAIPLAAVIFIITYWFSSRQANIANNTASWVAHTHEVLFHTEKLLRAGSDIETGSRAFLLTHQQHFLELFHESKMVARLETDSLKQLTSDNPLQQVMLDTLKVLMDARIASGDSIIYIEKPIELQQASAIVTRGEGKLYIDKLSTMIQKMQAEENRLLEIRKNDNREAVGLQHKLFIYSIPCMLIVLLYIFWKEKELIAKKEKEKGDILFRSLLESSPEAMIIANEQNEIIFTNRQAEILFEFDKGQLTGHPVRTVIPDALRLNAEKQMFELTAIKRAGNEFAAEISTVPVKTERGNLTSLTIRDVTDRNRSAELLKKSEEFFRLLVTGVKDYAIFMLDNNGRVASWNEGASNIKGYSENEIVGQSFELFYNQEDIEKGEPRHNLEMAKIHGHFEKEGWRLRKDGTRFWANVVFTALKDNDGSIYGYCKITKDNTERQQTQEQLEFLTRQIEQSNDAIYIVDADLKLRSWNKGAENLYGYTKEEVIGKDPNTVLNTDITGEQLQAARNELTTTGYWTGEIKRMTKSGNEIYLRSSTTSVRDEQGNITGFISAGFDITAQKKLMQEVSHLASIVEQSSEAIFSRGMHGHILSWNRGAEQLFGYKHEEAIGHTAKELGFLRLDSKKIGEIEKQVIETGQWTSEMHYYHRNGSSFFGAVTANLVRNEKAEISSFNFIIKDITLRRQLEEQLKQANEELEERVKERTAEIHKNEKRFRALVENNYDIITLIDASFKIIYRSPSVTRVMGFLPNEMKSLEGIENIHPDDREYAQDIIRQVISKPGQPVKAMFRRQHKDGHYIWLEGVITNLLHDEQVAAIVSNFRDVTEQNLSAEKLAASETRFRSLIENSAEGVSLLDRSHNAIYRSPGAVKMLGNSSVQQSINQAHPEDLETIKGKFGESLNKPLVPVPYTVRFRHASGHYFWSEGTFTNMLDIAGVNAVVSNYRDVTKRKDLEGLLNKANSLARIGGWEADLIKGTVYWTDITREIHETGAGYIPDLKNGIGFYKEGKSRDLIVQKVNEAIEDGKSWDLELQIITARNNLRWIRTIGETEFVDGRCTRIYGSFQDIDLRKRAEEKIKNLNTELEERVALRTGELKKINEELEAFSYSVSHDLRAPLRAIIGFTSKLETNYGNQLDDEAKRITSVIKNNTLKMGHLIDDLLSFSRMGRQEINKSTINTASLVKEIINTSATGNTRLVEWVIHPLPSVRADGTTIRQVWTNLISNAIKYSSKEPMPRIEIGGCEDNGMVVFFVKDNGVGFNEKYKAKLFKVFQRLHSGAEFEGTGIGLAIVDRIVSKHGGTVSADGELNKGACFRFSLPL